MESVPEKQFTARPISVTIWRKETGGKVSREISLSRRFKDKNGCWTATGILRLNDIPKVIMLMQEAYRYIVLNPGTDETCDIEGLTQAGLIKVM